MATDLRQERLAGIVHDISPTNIVHFRQHTEAPDRP